MPTYEPMSKATHIKRGTCCFHSRGEHSRCVHCPWYVSTRPPQPPTDPRIEEALRDTSGLPITIYIDQKSLVQSVTLNNRVTLWYNGYKPNES